MSPRSGRRPLGRRYLFRVGLGSGGNPIAKALWMKSEGRRMASVGRMEGMASNEMPPQNSADEPAVEALAGDGPAGEAFDSLVRGIFGEPCTNVKVAIFCPKEVCMSLKLAPRVISLLPLRIEPRFVFAAFVSSLVACGGAPADDVEVAPVNAADADAIDALDDVVFDDGAAVIEEDDVDVTEDSDVDVDEDDVDVTEDSDVDEDDVDVAEDSDEDVFTDASVEGSAAGAGHEQSPLNIATVNIGRKYKKAPHKMPDAIDEVKSKLKKSGPVLIGWQEIGEDDPCNHQCEIKAVRSSFDGASFHTFHPYGRLPHSTDKELVHVPITLRVPGNVKFGARFASWAVRPKISPTRFVTVTYSKKLKVAHLNTHLIAGAWSCGSTKVELRQKRWNQGWKNLRKVVEDQVDKGYNVVVTGDLNRRRPKKNGKNGCNKPWEPSSLYPGARVVGGKGLDYIFAVPADGQQFRYERKNGHLLRGSIYLGIDGHEGHWVTGHFEPKPKN